MPCNTNPFVHYFLILASGGCHVSILFLEMHSCYTPLFLHLHCAHDDLSIAYTLCFALAYAFPFVFLIIDDPHSGPYGPCVHCYLSLHFLRVYDVLLVG
jgi:hypothetical protein